ncbi:MAG: TonB-dependent receptor [Chlorobi bacterium]|nr:TonB-dependent receptor [Chlorobiota bacterium]
MRKAGSVFLILLFIFPATQAVPEGIDTLLAIPEVSVIAPRASLYHEDQKTVLLDSATRLEDFNFPVGELLQYYLPVQILQYGGRGALTSLSVRGGQSVNTQVQWNGFPMNSLTTGMTDLSSIRSGLFERMSLIAGAPGSLYGSGTAGGTLNLVNEPQWKDGLRTAISLSRGSFHTLSGDAEIKAGNGRIQYTCRIFGEDDLNDFSFYDEMKSGRPLVKNSHNRYILAGTSHSIFLRLRNGHQIQAGIWAQKSSREIPSIMGSYTPSFQQQQDSSLRMYIAWKKQGIKTVTGIRTAWFTEGMRFTDEAGPDRTGYTIDSHIRSGSSMTDAYMQWFPGEHWNFDFGSSFILDQATVDAYNQPVSEVRGTLSAGTKYKGRRTVVNLTARQIFPAAYSTPQVSAGIRYELVPGNWFLRARTYTHYRIPSLNDKYWNPGGNPELKPEKGWGTTAGIEGQWTAPAVSNLSLSVDVFYNRIRDQIMWIPEQSYWSPVNLQKSQMYGMEQQGSVKIKSGNFSMDISESYHFTRSAIMDNTAFSGYIGNTNPYIPRHSATAAVRLRYGKIYGTVFETFTGSRFTTMDNQEWYKLEPFAITSLASGYHHNYGTWKLSLQVMVRNLFNKSYRLVSAWPLPGRSFRLQVKIAFNPMSKP